MNKTLVIITPGFPVNEEDTSCIPPQQVFVKALKKNNPSLNIIVVTFQYPFLSEKYKWNGVSVISLGGKNRGNVFRVFLWIKAWSILKKIQKEKQVIGLLSFWLGECGFIGKYFGKKYKIKHFCWLLGQDAKAKNRYFSLMKPVPENLIAISDFIADGLYKNYAVRPQHIIPVGIDRSMFDEKKTDRDIDILGAGSLIVLKQYDVFIHAIREIKKVFPNIHVVLCGEGAEKKKLQILIDELDLQNNIILTGEVAHAAVLGFMQRTKLFLHTSCYEGFSTVCAEALYAGATVISFCKPMKENFSKWHIVNSQEEMIKKAIKVLQDKQPEYNPVLTYTIENATDKMMRLFVG